MTVVSSEHTASTSSADGGSRNVPWFAVGAGLLGVAYAIQAVAYGLGSIDAPGPGALPAVVGMLLAVAGAGVAVVERHRGVTSDGQDAEDESLFGEASSRLGVLATLLVAAAVCVFVVWQSRIVGLLPASGIAVAVLSWLMRSRVLTAAATGAGFYLVAYLVFEHWLEVPLPHGYL